jgi:hypothetical protein
VELLRNGKPVGLVASCFSTDVGASGSKEKGFRSNFSVQDGTATPVLHKIHYDNSFGFLAWAVGLFHNVSYFM